MLGGDNIEAEAKGKLGVDLEEGRKELACVEVLRQKQFWEVPGAESTDWLKRGNKMENGPELRKEQNSIESYGKINLWVLIF